MSAGLGVFQQLPPRPPEPPEDGAGGPPGMTSARFTRLARELLGNYCEGTLSAETVTAALAAAAEFVTDDEE